MHLRHVVLHLQLRIHGGMDHDIVLRVVALSAIIDESKEACAHA